MRKQMGAIVTRVKSPQQLDGSYLLKLVITPPCWDQYEYDSQQSEIHPLWNGRRYVEGVYRIKKSIFGIGKELSQ